MRPDFNRKIVIFDGKIKANQRRKGHNKVEITRDIIYAGVNDHQRRSFEGQYKVPNGMCYNSYVICDEKCAVMDTVDARFTHEWLDNLSGILKGKAPDYLIIQHMEPDHSANIYNFMEKLSQYNHCIQRQGVCHDGTAFFRI
mgnify:CR=1 FL=1